MPQGTLSLSAFHRRFPDEDAARAWFEKCRWPHGPECSCCGSIGEASWIRTRSVWSCKGCGHQFTVKTGTPLHRSHLPLLIWAQAIYLIVASSKGISALKLGQMLGISYPTAWYLGHRIRAMMQDRQTVLSGVVEIDETYAGGPPRKRAKGQPEEVAPHPAGRGTARPLVRVAAQREGPVFTQVISSHSRGAIAQALAGRLAPKATVMTDGLPAYIHLGDAHLHLSVTHSQREYARTDAASGHPVHVNRVESFNAFLQRAVTGVWHRISAKHLQRYTTETAFRWNRREPVLERMAGLIRSGAGALPYAVCTAA